MRAYVLVSFLCALSSFAAEMRAPEGYDVRDLGPMGGQIVVPKGWFFKASQAPSGSVYTISKEESSTGYDTGMRIQLISHVKATAGISPKQRVQMNVERKKKLEEVVDECPESKFDMFSRVCLETVGFPSKAKPTQKYHMVYSFWWSDELDLLAAVTFGAPVDQWSEARKVYDVIKDFKLIDFDRAPKRPNKAPC